MKGSGVVFTHGGGISTPRVRHKGRQPLIKCAKMTSNFFIFPFFMFMSFYAFLYFYLFVVDEGVSLAPTYSSIVIRKSDLRSSLWTKHLVKIFFILFCKICFYWMKGHLRRWTIKQSFDSFWKERKQTLRHWTINDLFIFWKR